MTFPFSAVFCESWSALRCGPACFAKHCPNHEGGVGHRDPRLPMRDAFVDDCTTRYRKACNSLEPKLTAGARGQSADLAASEHLHDNRRIEALTGGGSQQGSRVSILGNPPPRVEVRRQRADVGALATGARTAELEPDGGRTAFFLGLHGPALRPQVLGHRGNGLPTCLVGWRHQDVEALDVRRRLDAHARTAHHGTCIDHLELGWPWGEVGGPGPDAEGWVLSERGVEPKPPDRSHGQTAENRSCATEPPRRMCRHRRMLAQHDASPVREPAPDPRRSRDDPVRVGGRQLVPLSCRSSTGLRLSGQTDAVGKPWWRRLDGLPPGAERRRSEPMSRQAVVLTRLMVVAVVVIALAIAAGGDWRTAATILAASLGTLCFTPGHRLRQLAGRA